MRPNHLFALIIVTSIAAAGCSASEPSPPVSSPTTTTLAETGLDTAPSTTTTTWAALTEECSQPGTWGVCTIDRYEDRPYDVYVPSSYDPRVPSPVVIAIHGGGGKAESAIATTCADGDRSSPSCLHNIAEQEGFVVAYPNGSGFGVLPTLKTWNAGGGSGEYNCVSGQACERDIDDVAYFTAMLDHLESWVHVNTGMVFATGLSNGAAMSHRLACEMSPRFTAIAAVGGTNQFAATADCDLSIGVAVMQIHGTQDPCWTFEASDQACADRSGGIKVGVAESTSGWVERLGCDLEPVTMNVPDSVDDQTTTTRTLWSGCNDGATEVHLLTVEGGGHTWPGGDAYLPERRVGRVTRDWDSKLIWEFFSSFDRP